MTDAGALAAAARDALAERDVVAVTIGDGFGDGSPRRTSVVRALASRGRVNRSGS